MTERGKFGDEAISRDMSAVDAVRLTPTPGAHKLTTTYIFHVIGTLTMQHVRNALESLDRQDDFHWKRFLLYNGSPLDTDQIMEHVPLDRFDEHAIFPYDHRTPKGAIADWTVQMYAIGGTDRYFCHKADFYLAYDVCAKLDAISDLDFFALFKKVDMKERATLEDFRRLARTPWPQIRNSAEMGWYPGVVPGVSDDNHLGKLGVIWDGHPLDGTMHAYSDSFRPAWKVSDVEMRSHWAWLQSLYPMFLDFPYLILDDDFFALHQYHYTADRNDPIKAIPGERF